MARRALVAKHNPHPMVDLQPEGLSQPGADYSNSSGILLLTRSALICASRDSVT
jgi:hypothetical protein